MRNDSLISTINIAKLLIQKGNIFDNHRKWLNDIVTAYNISNDLTNEQLLTITDVITKNRSEIFRIISLDNNFTCFLNDLFNFVPQSRNFKENPAKITSRSKNS